VVLVHLGISGPQSPSPAGPPVRAAEAEREIPDIRLSRSTCLRRRLRGKIRLKTADAPEPSSGNSPLRLWKQADENNNNGFPRELRAFACAGLASAL
jgi:hypothetical protein